MKKKNLNMLMGILIVGCIMYKVANHYNNKPQKSIRYSSYLNSKKNILTIDDTLKINAFSKKLKIIFNHISQNSQIEEFSNINSSVISSSFEPKVCTYAFLDFICSNDIDANSIKIRYKNQFSTKINTYFGEGDFNYEFLQKKWNGGILSEIDYFEKDTYIMILKTNKLDLPKLIGESSYISGRFEGTLFVYDINSSEIMAIKKIIAYNEESIKHKKYIKGSLLKKLTEDLSTNIVNAVSKQSKIFFGIALPSIDDKIYGFR